MSIGRCDLHFENRSKDPVTFNVAFYDRYWYESEHRSLSLLNDSSPYEVTLEGNAKKVVSLEKEIDVSNETDPIQRMEFDEVNIIIFSDDGRREL
ncbi:hypothetical protein [Salipaludibacillus aurantiacus]|uniref:hypothetical protein n=1 Tax=Salipaludibacillus aurantiacus TaxID=1601833 RepID=UPI000B892BAF|nr:hypothetical protein [Salipaludibacillus aurantiacus]